MERECAEVKVQVSIPIDRPDANGCISSTEVVQKMLSNSKHTPLVYHSESYESIPIGFATENLSIGNNCIKGNFIVWDKKQLEDLLAQGDIIHDISCRNVSGNKEDGIYVISEMDIDSVNIVKGGRCGIQREFEQ